MASATTGPSKMRVGIDVRLCLAPGAGGHTYTRELVLALSRVGLDLTMWFAGRQVEQLRAGLAPELQALGERVPLRTSRCSNQLLYSPPALAVWSRWPRRLPPPRLLPRELDLYHAVYWPLPLDPVIPMVLTIHDLVGLRHPTWFTSATCAELEAIRRLAPRAAHVVTDSEATRQDVLELVGLPPERVTTVPLGVEQHLLGVPDPEQVAEARVKYDLARPYLVALGTREPRKNLARLIDAYDRLEDVEHELVLVGAEGWGDDEVGPRLARDRRGRVHLTGYVPREDLPLLLAGASATAYVSLAEGFGLPPLEAMACGCPVVTSNCSSLPEVVGGAAVMVDPQEVEAIADGLQRVLTDEALADDLRRRGRARAAEFTWERTARETLQVYRRALDERGG